MFKIVPKMFGAFILRVVETKPQSPNGLTWKLENKLVHEK